ncbi:uroporphyrinogen decarboxylase family protein [Chloroflexota bacterium]
MDSRERIKRLLAFQEPDRIGKQDGFWEDTLSSWHAQGMPADVAPGDYFDFDFDNLFIDASLRLPERLIEDTDEYTVRADKHGFVAKQWKGKAGALGYEAHSINDRADWERLKGNLAVDYGGASRLYTESYFTPFVGWPTWEAMGASFQALQQRQKFTLVHVYGPHEANWRKHGFEQTLMNMVLDPGLMADMSRVHVDLIIATLEKGRENGIVPDGLFMAEDLGVNTGPMFSLAAYEQILFPEHRRLGDYLQSAGIAYFIHTDGDVRRFIPHLIDAGVQVLQPMEARAHLDVRELKAQYGRDLAFMGNIAVEAMTASEAELEREIRDKLAVAMQNGGYIYHSDHSVPSSVSLKRYQTVMALLDKYGQYT